MLNFEFVKMSIFKVSYFDAAIPGTLPVLNARYRYYCIKGQQGK